MVDDENKKSSNTHCFENKLSDLGNSSTICSFPLNTPAGITSHITESASNSGYPSAPAVINTSCEHIQSSQWPGGISPIDPIPRSNQAYPSNDISDIHPPTLTHEQFEMDRRKLTRFRVLHVPICRHNVKKCMHSYQSLPARTRQSLRIAGIILISAVAIVSVFYLSQIGGESESYGLQSIVINEKKRIQVSLQRDGYGDEYKLVGDNVDFPLQYDVEKEVIQQGAKVPPQIIKDANGKAKEYEKDFPLNGGIPMISDLGSIDNFDIHRLHAFKKRPNISKKRLKRPATESEINQTLNLIQKKLDVDRKQISDKELRYWESGVEPLRVLLVSTWRSGSTFLATTIYSHPGVFEHHEPLSYFGVKQVRSGKDAFQSQQLLHRLLDCDFNNVEAYLNYTTTKPLEMFAHNSRVWKACDKVIHTACNNKDFLSKSCKMFPIQLVKTVRMRLNATQLLLNDAKLRVKVIFLVRDPRGTMNSRISSVKWCNESSDCSDPSVLCQDLEGDLKVAKAFENLYPDRFLKVKYEDLSTEPVKEVEKVMSFLGLEYTEDIKSFVYKNTHTEKNSPWSTTRKSSDRIGLWKKQLKPEKVFEIQEVCEPVLEALKYDIIPRPS